MKAETQTYVLFPNHHEGLSLQRKLKEAGISCTISPTPRSASTHCGISLLVQADDVEVIWQIIREQGILVEKIVTLPRKRTVWD